MKQHKYSVAVVIPNWNGKDLLDDCLKSLKQQTLPHQAILVDNGSTDGSIDFVEHNYPAVQILNLPVNRGFSGSVNVGIKWAMDHKFDYVALLNNDAIARPDWLEKLMKAAAITKAGIVTSKIVSDDGSIDSTGDYYSVWGLSFPRGRGEVDRRQYDSAEYVPAASGGASLYDIQIFKDVGYFDEEFFAYYEDVDISYRAQLAGWKIYYEPSAVAEHLIGATSKKIPGFSAYHSTKNFYYLYTKLMPSRLYWKYLLKFLTSASFKFASALKNRWLGTWLKAHARLLLTLPSMLIKRYRIQSRRKLTDDEFDKLLFHDLPPTEMTMKKVFK